MSNETEHLDYAVHVPKSKMEIIKESMNLLSTLVFILVMVAVIFVLWAHYDNARTKAKFLKCGFSAGTSKLVL